MLIATRIPSLDHGSRSSPSSAMQMSVAVDAGKGHHRMARGKDGILTARCGRLVG